MDNPETLTKLSTQDTGLRQIKHKKHNITQKTRKMSNTDLTKNRVFVHKTNILYRLGCHNTVGVYVKTGSTFKVLE
jgi:hypothetical protein